MKAMNAERMREIAVFLLRIVAGLMFMQAGGMKIFDWFGGIPAEHGGHPAMLSQAWIGGVLEFYGGVAILIGVATQPVAFILSGMMAVAYFQFHQPQGVWPVQNGGQPAVLYCFIFLFFAACGGGDWSADAWIRRRRDAGRTTSPRAAERRTRISSMSPSGAPARRSSRTRRRHTQPPPRRRHANRSRRSALRRSRFNSVASLPLPRSTPAGVASLSFCTPVRMLPPESLVQVVSRLHFSSRFRPSESRQIQTWP